MTVLRWLDIAVLVLGLPVFIALDAPLLAYVACSCAWLIGRGAHLLAGRRAKAALGEGKRNLALGVMAGASLGRAWLVALTVLIVGLTDRDAGLAAALFAVALFSAYFAGLAIERLSDPERSRV
jgi:hypothetical protein